MNRVQRRKARRRKVAKRAAIAGTLAVSVGLLTAMGTMSGSGQKIAEVETRPVAVITQEQLLGELPIHQITPELAEAPAEPKFPWTDQEVDVIAKTVYGEALVTNSDTEMAAVVWCILNRVDSPLFPDSILEVVTKSQFHGYSEENPVDTYIKILVEDVLFRWNTSGEGRVLPREYLYFWGDGLHNHFTTEFMGGTEWDWSLETPYAS